MASALSFGIEIELLLRPREPVANELTLRGFNADININEQQLRGKEAEPPSPAGSSCTPT
ncbi:hypothetical protein I7I53_00497 [Histoplasma capsulatum var. duboisii H88]|uniref:Uncharacterized protein n=1 Tax=Ajellomyces capsulatus (strain H88) TaxID=544711 RepID=A0A8A1LIH3_AJEC8|nr:hypothetical protein I7I53_00497 [Histoplasma capsulatum var. duboisii H88]